MNPRMLQPPACRRIREERGQSLVELVLGLPLLLFVLTAILQFGLVLHDFVEVADAARHGARKASVSRNGVPAAAAEEAARDSTSGLDQDRLAVTVDPERGVSKGEPVGVEVSYPFEVDVLGLVLKKGKMTYRATARMQ